MTDPRQYPKLDKVAKLPEEAELYEYPYPCPPEGGLLLAMDDEGNVFNLGKKPALYVVEDPEAE